MNFKEFLRSAHRTTYDSLYAGELFTLDNDACRVYVKLNVDSYLALDCGVTIKLYGDTTHIPVIKFKKTMLFIDP